jgi:hypothetical protein
MSLEARCLCGASLPAAHDLAESSTVCPRCGRLLNAPPLQAKLPVETIQLPAYYELDPHPQNSPSAAPPAADPWNYKLVEVPAPPVEFRPPAEPEDLDLPYHVEDAPARPKTRLSEAEDRAMRRAVLQAKRDLRRYQRPRSRPWPLERNGWECLLFPLRVWWAILSLSFAWVLIAPLYVSNLPDPDQAWGVWLAHSLFLVFPLALVGVTWNYLREVLLSGVLANREVGYDAVFNFPGIVHSGFRVIVALLAGPIVLIIAALWFWISAGTLRAIDQLVLYQLGLCAAIFWVYLLLAIDDRGRLCDAHGAAVVRLVVRQGWPGRVFPLVGGVSVAVLVWILTATWTFSFENAAAARMLEFMLWFATLCGWTVLLRWYGLHQHWRLHGGGFDPVKTMAAPERPAEPEWRW